MGVKEDLQRLLTGQTARKKRGKSANLNLHVLCTCLHEQLKHLGDIGPCQAENCTCQEFVGPAPTPV